MGGMRNAYNILDGEHFEDLGVDGKIILERILGNRVERFGLDTSGSGQGPVVGSCEHSNEPSVSIKGREFLD
jgi:hypothetical protein